MKMAVDLPSGIYSAKFPERLLMAALATWHAIPIIEQARI